MTSRLLLLVLLALATWCAPGDALATCTPNVSSAAIYDCATREEAYVNGLSSSGALEACKRYNGSYTIADGMTVTTPAGAGGAGPPAYAGATSISKNCRVSAQGSYSWQTTHYRWAVQCVAPATWDSVSNTCYSAAQCLARNAGITGPSTWNVFQECRTGCKRSMAATGYVSTSTTLNGVTTTFYTSNGPFHYTGESCGATPVNPNPALDPASPPAQHCVPAVNGQTACVKNNGDTCYTASTGRQICWARGETGSKLDGALNQIRNAGNTPIAPTLQLPSGDSLSASGQSMVTASTASGQTTTTTVQNYITTYGTNAGDTNNGESNTGDGTGTITPPGTTGASGGGDCNTSPIVTGDAALSMVATQAWATRCAVEAGNAANITGDVTDCAQPFTVTGTNANAQQLRGLRAQICGDPNEAAPAEADYLGDPGTPGGGLVESEGVNDVTASLDTGGLGFSRSCPTVPTLSLLGKSVTIDTANFCGWMQISAGFILLLGALISARIIGSA